MQDGFRNHFEPRSSHKGIPPRRESPPSNGFGGKLQSYSKVFRWRLPDGQTHAPGSVELVGSFTQWQKVPLKRDSEVDAWHVTVHHIPGNRTHHYMLLVDGKPVQDKDADGMAVPHGPQEEQYQLMTSRGGRVFLLYAQTK